MTSKRPYLVRAIHEWLLDNNSTPYILIDADFPGVRVPLQYVKDGRITLNIAPGAVNNLFIRNEGVTFSARFNGVAMQIDAPIDAVLAIFSRENGDGMAFDPVDPAEDGGEDGASDNEPVTLQAVDTDGSGASPDDEPPSPTPPRRPSLRVVK